MLNMQMDNEMLYECCATGELVILELVITWQMLERGGGSDTKQIKEL
jgi:hypothetical protein